jgi:hypothetical protein
MIAILIATEVTYSSLVDDGEAPPFFERGLALAATRLIAT